MASTPLRMLGYTVVVIVNISVIVKVKPSLLGLGRASAAARNIAIVSGVCLCPKNELFEPNRSGLSTPEGLIGIRTLSCILYSGRSKSIQYCSATAKSLGFTSRITSEKLASVYLLIALHISDV